VLYYDPNASVAGGAVLISEMTNIITTDGLKNLNAGDFGFILNP
jgi:hypothetical protein